MPRDSYIIIMDGIKRHFPLGNVTYENNLTSNEEQALYNHIVYEALYCRFTNPRLFWYACPPLFDNGTTTDHMFSDLVHKITAWYVQVYLYQFVSTSLHL